MLLGNTKKLELLIFTSLALQVFMPLKISESTNWRVWYPKSLLETNNANLRHSQEEQQPLSSARVLVGLKALWPQQLKIHKRWKALNDSYLDQLNVLQDKERAESDRQRKLAYAMSPLAGQILEVGSELGSENFIAFSDAYRAREKPPAKELYTAEGPLGLTIDECQSIRSTVQLVKDEVDKASGRILRTCRGLVQVNRCEGTCGSSVQPSIKSPTGFKKDCLCCNEGSFRRVRVRLNECVSPLEVQPTSDSGRIRADYLDVEIEEPIECGCRHCDGLS